jgi:hypothetical protein
MKNIFYKHIWDVKVFLSDRQFFSVRKIKISIFSIDNANLSRLFLLDKLVNEQGL